MRQLEAVKLPRLNEMSAPKSDPHGAGRGWLQPRSPFPFPFTPYPIQQQLMSAVYTTVRKKRVGIFESPTGTGKTLSLICSTLQWLREYQEYGSDSEEEASGGGAAGGGGGGGGAAGGGGGGGGAAGCAEPDWCVAFDAERAKREKASLLARGREARTELMERLVALRSEEEAGAVRAAAGSGAAAADPAAARAARRASARAAAAAAAAAARQARGKRQRVEHGGIGGGEEWGGRTANAAATDEERDWLVGEYHSGSDTEDEEGLAEAAARSMDVAERIRSGLREKRAALAGAAAEAGEEDEGALFRPKVFYVSRTHTQISQFVGELARTVFGRTARVVALGARKNLCVNEDVVALGSDARVNERCLELADAARRAARGGGGAAAAGGRAGGGAGGGCGGSAPSGGVRGGVALAGGGGGGNEKGEKKGAGCPFTEPALLSTYRERLVARVRDVEEAADLGWDMGACGYYGARRALPLAEVVTLPYSMLLSAGARAATGIDVRGSVVIVDEAHNLLDAINGAHAVSVGAPQLAAAHAMVRAYVRKYRTRMRGRNEAYCSFFADALLALLEFLEVGGGVPPSALAAAARAEAAADRAEAAAAAAAGGGAPHSPPSSRSRSVAGGGSSAGSALGTPSSAAPPPTPPAPTPAPAPLRVVAAGFSMTAFFSGSAPSSATPSPSRPLGIASGATNPTSRPPSFALAGARSGGAPPAAPPYTATTPSAGTPFHPPRAVPFSAAASAGGGLPAPSPMPPPYAAPPLWAPPAPFATPPAPPPPPPRPPTAVLTVPEFILAAGLESGGGGDKVILAAGLVSGGGGDTGGDGGCGGSVASGRFGGGEGGGGGINLFKLRRYLEASQLLRKLRGFAEAGAHAAAAGEVMIHARGGGGGGGGMEEDATASGAGVGGSYMTAVSAAQAAASFFFCLTGAEGDGRLLVSRGSGGGGGTPAQIGAAAPLSSAVGGGGSAATPPPAAPPGYKFILLNPATPFKAVVTAARSVILAGGTMQPIGDLVTQLFSESVPLSRVATFSCGHIVPRDALACFTVASGPTGVPFNFRHGARSGPALMTELGRALLSAAAVVPAGVVVFLPSYDYLRTLLAHLALALPGGGEEGGGAGAPHPPPPPSAPAFPVKPAPGSLLARLALRKRLFCEPKGASEVEAVWSGFAGAARAPPPPPPPAANSAEPRAADSAEPRAGASASPPQPRGALLFAVVGGKMSEGINFSDDLARAVVMVGMPYGNPSDPELRERMAYLDRRGGGGGRAASASPPASSPGREYYENLCLRAVNQSIGRSIRHVEDHAVILLLDQRYAAPAVRAKLPGWIGDRVVVQEGWGPVVAGVGAFFREKRSRAAAASAAAPPSL